MATGDKSKHDLPSTIFEVPTPCFLVDIDKVQKNCQRMTDRCAALRVDLRPHQKTHKTIEGAELMTGGTKKKIVVSTLSEAEFFVDNGFDDVLYGYPITESKLSRCRDIFSKCLEFHLMFDNMVALSSLEKISPGPGKRWSVYLEIDVGHNRTGVDWQDNSVVDLALRASKSVNIDFKGIYTHNGNSYAMKTEDALKECGAEGTQMMMAVHERLVSEGITCNTVGIGSTPSCTCPDHSMSKLTEFHPGNYIFYDYMQSLIGTCTVDEIACCVATRVISHKPNLGRFYIDCGFIALSHDGVSANLPQGPCMFKDHPELKLTSMTQEIGYVTASNGDVQFEDYPIDSMLFIYPYHSCATAANHDVYYIHSGDKIVGTWRPNKGW